ncbi:MAG: magnesium/cobalt transporter CorA [Syntrophomonadaceae bacterium]
MLHTVLVTNELEILTDVPLSRLSAGDAKWFWIDFDAPREEEAALLSSHFHFHPLAIEDCFQYLQRPKLDYYDTHNFFVLQYPKSGSMDPEEIDFFVGPDFIVTVHLQPCMGLDEIRQHKLMLKSTLNRGPLYLFYLIMDKLVDDYFPPMYEIEDKLYQLGDAVSNPKFINDVFDLRDQLLRMRRIILPMRDLMYRILNSDRLIIPKDERHYFRDIDDHLHKLAEMVESSRDVTADLRDSYVSLNSNRMNTIMTTLTIVATIFIPLTFIVGVYGMNFDNMPELRWNWGYYAVWIVMVVVAAGMLLWLKKKGWYK